MPDHGHDLQFGIFVMPRADQLQHVLDLALLTERVGLDLVSFPDHPYDTDMVDTWTLLSVVAARTTRVRVAPNVANVALRPPAMLARSAVGLDILSGGRVELGLGAGAFWDAIVAMGGPRRTSGESVAALEEAVRVIRALWTPGEPVHLHGTHYQLDGAAPGPIPPHDIGIWIGAYQARMLRLAGRLADGWLPSAPYLPPEHLAAANQVIDDAAAEAGRSPRAVRRLYNIAGEFSSTGNGFLQGPPRMWAEQLAELTLTHGMGTYILYMVESADTVRRFAAEVAPAVRETVAAERARSA